MATNPNNAIGTNAAYGGRTSPKAFNDVLSAFDGRGILSGWQVAPNSGMAIALGGDGDNRDVAIAEDNAGNMTTVNNITGSPITFAIAAAPASQSRIDAIVVYVNNPPQGASSVTDNYGAVGILDVQGTVASTPAKPNDSDIRTAITADGASGATAYYVVLGYVTIPNGTTTITSNLIEQGSVVVTNIVSTDIVDGIVTADKIASSAVTTGKIAPSAVTTGKIANGAVTPAKLGDTGWIDASSQAGLNRCFYRKVGNIVYITLESAGNKTIGASYTTVFTLPVGFRPSIDWNFVWQNISNADSRQNGWIKTSGTIELYSNTSKDYWYGSTSFPVD